MFFARSEGCFSFVVGIYSKVDEWFLFAVVFIASLSYYFGSFSDWFLFNLLYVYVSFMLCSFCCIFFAFFSAPFGHVGRDTLWPGVKKRSPA